MNLAYNTIILNGETLNCISLMSIYDLLVYLEFDVSRVVVEYNSKIIPNNDFDNILINNNDRLEVITIVGGG
uniref:Thiamine biosynthesis protein S n=1 Tax=Riquetophycus sp. TaxID=1897556 RepID=A0A1C9C8D8_9FLOR|nr:thiamine biosynthesis protein S [Riquetophycus sp.]